jgi:hypothetical protein
MNNVSEPDIHIYLDAQPIFHWQYKWQAATKRVNLNWVQVNSGLRVEMWFNRDIASIVDPYNSVHIVKSFWSLQS